MAPKQRNRPARLVGCPDCRDWAKRYHALVGEMMAMKRDGFTPSPTAGPKAMELPQLDPKVRQAMAEISSPGDSIWRHNEAQAWELAAQGRDPQEIAALIRAGEEAPL